MNSVLVLLSTYNGEKYISQQIDSLLNQKNVDVHILIRDDGSSDRTIEIIKGYKNDKINLVIGEKNIGAANSFIELLFIAPKYKFYAYCDQDDVWNPKKLYIATSKLEREHGPSLYMSTYDVVDKDLNYIRTRNMEFDIPFTIEEVIVNRSPSGCTMVFNYALKAILTTGRPHYIRMHDFWTLMTVLSFRGNIITDNRSMLLYRQHENNTVGVSANTYVKIKRLLKSAFKNKNERQRQAASLVSLYDNMDPEIKERVNMTVFYKKDLLSRFRFAFNREYMPRTIRNKILFITSVILGVF